MEKENVIRKAKRLAELPDCFIKHDGNYNFKSETRKLPVVQKKYEYVLKDLYINTYSYFQTVKKDGRKTEYIKYWNEYVYKEEEVTLPVYEYRGGMFYYSGTRTEKIPTQASVDAANNLKIKVDERIHRIQKVTKEKFLRQQMDNQPAACLDDEEYRTPFKEGRLGDLFIFCIKKKNGQGNYLIVFDLLKIYDDEAVKLEVPKSIMNHVLGENNCNAEKWADTLDIEELRISPV